MEEQAIKNERNPIIKRTHKVGTITLGIILVLFGGVFLVRLFVPALTYDIIWRLWPFAMISLGIEVLISTFRSDKAKYDGWGIFLTFLITVFAMGMAWVEWFYSYWQTAISMHCW